MLISLLACLPIWSYGQYNTSEILYFASPSQVVYPFLHTTSFSPNEGMGGINVIPLQAGFTNTFANPSAIYKDATTDPLSIGLFFNGQGYVPQLDASRASAWTTGVGLSGLSRFGFSALYGVSTVKDIPLKNEASTLLGYGRYKGDFGKFNIHMDIIAQVEHNLKLGIGYSFFAKDRYLEKSLDEEPLKDSTSKPLQAFDIGLCYQGDISGIRPTVGISLKNARFRPIYGNVLTSDSSVLLSDSAQFFLPTFLHVGAGLEVPLSSQKASQWVLSGGYQLDAPMFLDSTGRANHELPITHRLGGQIKCTKNHFSACFRLGYVFQNRDPNMNFIPFAYTTMGLGLGFRQFMMDLSWVLASPNPALSNTFNISLSYQFITNKP